MRDTEQLFIIPEECRLAVKYPESPKELNLIVTAVANHLAEQMKISFLSTPEQYSKIKPLIQIAEEFLAIFEKPVK